MGIRKAAAEFGVARSTLSDRLSGKWKKNSFGPNRMLTEEEENGLVAYINYMASHGFPLSRSMTRCFVIQIMKESGIPIKIQNV